MSGPQEYAETMGRKGKALETPEASRRIPIDPQPNHIVITAEAYEELVRISERLRLIENYIINANYPDKSILRAMVGYTGEE